MAKLDAPKFCSRLAMFTSAPVTILVGPQKDTFNIPKDVLCHHSRYFDCCLNGAFKEARENQVILEEDSVEAFQLIIHWIFTGNLALPWVRPMSQSKQKLTMLIRWAGFGCSRSGWGHPWVLETCRQA